MSKRKYMAFLSHYKVEAGSDARYLKDLLQRMTNAQLYLDSSDLVDLSSLFEHGVHDSDVFVLLCTKRVLTRPWCLLELYEAHCKSIPVVCVHVQNSRFPSNEHNKLLIADLETQLDTYNEGAMKLIMNYLDQKKITLDEFKHGLLSALCLNESAKAQKLCTWRPWGSDNSVIADGIDLIEAMAAAADRKLQWPHLELAHAEEQKAERSVRSKRLSSDGKSSTTLFDKEMEQANSRALKTNEMFEVFVSYYRDEAGLDARLLHTALELRLGKPCFLDASCASNLLGEGLDEIRGIIAHGMKRSRALVLLQTKSVLTRPFVLLEIFTALELKIPIITVNISEEGHPGDGYDFEKAKAFLVDLETQLEAANPGAVECIKTYLSDRPVGPEGTPDALAPKADFPRLQEVLSKFLPNVISIALSPDGTENHWRAVVQDIIDKISMVKTRKPRRVSMRDQHYANEVAAQAPSATVPPV